jgi:nitric oxide reductase subunit B
MAPYSATFSIRRLWIIFAVGMLVMFGTLLYFGAQIYQAAPPIPTSVRTASGEELLTREKIERGQNVWQSMGGMQQGSIWGHGSYVAPDWSADWLHREALALLDINARAGNGGDYAQLPAADQARAKFVLQQEMRTNTFDPETGIILVSDARGRAIAEVGAHYSSLFQGSSPEAQSLREEYAFPLNAMLSAEDAEAVNAFFFWTAWAATTNRPGEDITYTSNWPHEPLVGNTPTGAVFMWTFISIFVLLAGIGAIVWYYAKEFDIWRRDGEPETGFAAQDFMDAAVITPSMRATGWYFMLVAALFVVQVLLGMVTAHYAVEGQGIYGLPFAEYFPYAVTRTWHTQLAILWIATAWLATGLYVGPLLGGREPKFQAAGVWFLLISLVVIVAGSFIGEWSAVNRLIADATQNFWFGHQGYEFLDLGRFWQIYLFIGLLLWVVLVLRGMWPALKRPETRSFSIS